MRVELEVAGALNNCWLESIAVGYLNCDVRRFAGDGGFGQRLQADGLLGHLIKMMGD
jgi:hypothetical protein